MTARMLSVTLLILSIIAMLVINDKFLIGNVGILWLAISHVLFGFIIYSIRNILED